MFIVLRCLLLQDETRGKVSLGTLRVGDGKCAGRSGGDRENGDTPPLPDSHLRI